MAKYVVLMNWTDQGVKAAKDTVNRYHQSKALVENMGGKVETILWTVGGYDLVVVTEAPDDETLSAILLTLEPAIFEPKRFARSTRVKCRRFSTRCRSKSLG